MIDFDTDFPFNDGVFLSAEPMTDEAFAAFVRIENDEIPIETIDFSDPVLG